MQLKVNNKHFCLTFKSNINVQLFIYFTDTDIIDLVTVFIDLRT